VENHRLTLEIEVHEQERLIARGLVIRAVVDRVSFLAKAAAQSLSHQ
jgi:predicted thioesterase